eukprot:CAMPEP_0198342046 /NCGR_PEP_ID=MMETSP1450-20131203/50824_1 /TAXON_ID=753684 ORGANISM="Madagascaria erythrocladiodes, Strain CCMP3234" /NCGR_SAMPLE_ID=MMETSP1450 /ASSEMBLY_ACC=CAM_ASM_001115 /LENGTH=76 /DNA_ID=CAMNT_0044047119 /DNA_START=95 /DNA_END=325 /DNA_ORIENTATION=-
MTSTIADAATAAKDAVMGEPKQTHGEAAKDHAAKAINEAGAEVSQQADAAKQAVNDAGADVADRVDKAAAALKGDA